MDQLSVMLPCWATCILFLQNDINLKSKHDGEDCLRATVQLPPLVINELCITEVVRPWGRQPTSAHRCEQREWCLTPVPREDTFRNVRARRLSNGVRRDIRRIYRYSVVMFKHAALRSDWYPSARPSGSSGKLPPLPNKYGFILSLIIHQWQFWS